MTELADVFKWMTGRDAGQSSKAIAMHMTSGFCDGSYPHDPSDLGRCLRLLDRFPEWKPRMAEMARYGPVWGAYCERWEEMAVSMTEEVGIDWSKGQKAQDTYGLMRGIIDGLRKRGERA